MATQFLKATMQFVDYCLAPGESVACIAMTKAVPPQNVTPPALTQPSDTRIEFLPLHRASSPLLLFNDLSQSSILYLIPFELHCCFVLSLSMICDCMWHV